MILIKFCGYITRLTNICLLFQAIRANMHDAKTINTKFLELLDKAWLFIWCLISNNHLVSHIEIWKMCHLTINLIVEVLDNILNPTFVLHLIDESKSDLGNSNLLYSHIRMRFLIGLKFLTCKMVINVSYFGWEYAVAVIK